MTKDEWTRVQDLSTAYYRATGIVWKWPNRITLADDVLVELYEKGMNPATIGEVCGASRKAVSTRLKKAGVQTGRNLRGMTDEAWDAFQEYATKHYYETGEILPPPEGCGRKIALDTAVIVDLYVECKMSIPQIAKVFGCAASTIHDRLRREGVEMRRPNEYPRSEKQKMHVDEVLCNISYQPMKDPKVRAAIRAKGEAKRNIDCQGMYFGPEYYNGKGYILVYVPEHPYAQKRGHVMKHRLVMEQMLGRYLTPDEAVHHINGIKTDNRPENLQLMNKKAHLQYHADKRKKEAVHT